MRPHIAPLAAVVLVAGALAACGTAPAGSADVGGSRSDAGDALDSVTDAQDAAAGGDATEGRNVSDAAPDAPPDAPTCPDAADLNACGGCTPLRAEPGSACGPCQESAFTCAGSDDVICDFALCACTSDAGCSTGEACTAGTCAPEGWAWIPPGEFVMGLSEEETFVEDPLDHSGTVNVRLTRGFVMQRFELSRDEATALLGYDATDGGACASPCPAHWLTGRLAREIANAMSERDGFPSCFDPADEWPPPAETRFWDCLGYRVPMSAEWEYAARAATTTMTYAGNMSQEGVFEFSFADAVASQVGYYVANWNEEFGPVDGSCSIERRCGPGPVGRHLPNAFGLYDILGNVEEVVLDTFDPRREDGGSDIVGVYAAVSSVRGGSYISPYVDLRAARFGWSVNDDDPAFFVGVRLVRTVIQ